jgi:hypothetical protein
MRLGTVALVIALALVALPTPAPAQVPSGPLSIHVEADLGAPTTVGARMVFLFNGTAVLTSRLLEGGQSSLPTTGLFLSSGQLADYRAGQGEGLWTVVCTGKLDDGGNGSGRCAISGEFDGGGTWAGRIDVEARSLVVDMHLQVVCLRCTSR